MGKQLSKAERKALKRQKAQETDVLALAQGGTAVAEAEEAEETPETPPETPETPEETPETGETEAEAAEEKPAEGGDTPVLSLADLVRSAQGISESTSLKPKVKKSTSPYPQKSIFLDDWVSRIIMRFRPPPS
jgi:hypothetical protein